MSYELNTLKWWSYLINTINYSTILFCQDKIREVDRETRWDHPASENKYMNSCENEKPEPFFTSTKSKHETWEHVERTVYIVLLYSFTDTALLYHKILLTQIATNSWYHGWKTTVLLCWWSQGKLHLWQSPPHNLSDLALRLYSGLFHRFPVYKSWNEDCQWNGEGDNGQTNPKHSPSTFP